MRFSAAALAMLLASEVAAFDTSTDPCVDFYEFACGGWRRANPIPPDQTRWGRFNELAERNRVVLRDVLEQASTDCIAGEYDGFVSVEDPVNGDVHLNSRLTLGENTADQGGLRVAYRALQKTLEGKPRERIDGYSPEQRFFLGFANVWCQNVTEPAARQLAQTDPHSPGRFRVTGSVSNSEEFRAAFGCKAGQPMVRENACRAW